MTDAATPAQPTPNEEPVLRADKVTIRFGGLVANRDIDFVIPRRSIVSLIGPNGAGKTTFFNQLTGMLQPTSGSIVLDGTPTIGLPPHKIVELGIGRTFQNIRLFNEMTVLANVMVGRHVRMSASWVGSLLRFPGDRLIEFECPGPECLIAERVVAKNLPALVHQLLCAPFDLTVDLIQFRLQIMARLRLCPAAKLEEPKSGKYQCDRQLEQQDFRDRFATFTDTSRTARGLVIVFRHIPLLTK